jgi:F420-non-reducing hydrogenase iron-sulfur subunit
VEYVKKLLSEIGLEPDRVQMFNMSAAMAGEFARVAQEMTEQVETLGQNRLREAGMDIEGNQIG